MHKVVIFSICYFAILCHFEQSEESFNIYVGGRCPKNYKEIKWLKNLTERLLQEAF